MAECLITNGWDCPSCTEKFQTAGIEKDEVWIGNHSEISAYGSIVTNEINALTFATYKGLKKICFHKDTIQGTEELDDSRLFYNQTIEGRVIDDSTSVLTAINDMVNVDLVIIFKKKNGNYYLFGKDGGITLSANAKTTGATAGDEIGDLLTFTGQGLGKAPKFLDTDAATTQVTLDGYVV